MRGWHWSHRRTQLRLAAPCQSAAGSRCWTGPGGPTPGCWRMTFSKTLAPALRLGFAIVPAPLVPAFVRLRTLTDRGTDAFTQATLAEFMRLGLLAPHIRKMRTEYARRREALLEAMRRIVQLATPLAAPGGLHMVARLPDGMDEAAAVRACRARELAVSPLRAYYPGTPRMTGLVIGFAATPTAMANEVARRLEAALSAVARQITV
jgi:GntR family transcriptional regulator/MocR family aminotransferase